MKTLSSKIIALRKKAKLTQPHLATAAGISKSTMWKIENKPEFDPCLSTVIKIAEALRVDVVKLLR